jgi:tRNA (mo5U34)-methyltransferase
MFTRWNLESLLERLGYRLVRSSSVALPLAGYTDNRVSLPNIELLPDDELERLNAMLPWASFVADTRGRRFGAAFAADKRAEAQAIPDPRIVELDRRVPLSGLAVLEVGSFEGNHTIALCQRAKHVVALDGRIENVVKTIVRCSLAGCHPTVLRIDLEEALPAAVDLACDVLHHVGVLYHLSDPVDHLYTFCALTRRAVMLDTHVAPESGNHDVYSSRGREWRYLGYAEAGRAAPFAGLENHAKWLRESDLIAILNEHGFTSVDVARRVEERNGTRVLIYAERPRPAD